MMNKKRPFNSLNKTPNPFAHSPNFDTGSLVLNGFFSTKGIRRGKVLQLASDNPRLSLLVLLNVCHTAIQRGEKVLFCDVAGRLHTQSQLLRRAGLLKADSIQTVAGFQVCSPRTIPEIDELLQKQMALPQPPALVVIDSLFDTLSASAAVDKHSRFDNVAEYYGRMTYNILFRCKLHGANTGGTFFFTNPFPNHLRSQAMNLPTEPCPIESMVGTLHRYSDVSLALGDHNKTDDSTVEAPTITLPILATRQGDDAPGSQQVLALHRDGRFNNAWSYLEQLRKRGYFCHRGSSYELRLPGLALKSYRSRAEIEGFIAANLEIVQAALASGTGYTPRTPWEHWMD